MSGAASTSRRRGFTLLEMVVVLAILGLATAMVAPSVLHSIGTWQRRGEVESVLDQVRGLPAVARTQGRDLVMNDESLAASGAPLHVADGWTLATDKQWRVRHNGVCEAGWVAMESGGRATWIEVTAPFCDPKIKPD
ncbi:MAG: type II secretion system protein [Arenimonas sp.]